MSTRKRVKKANQNLHKQIWKLPSAAIKRLKKWLLRSLLVTGRRVRLSKSGFVLPTVAMVILVVVLLTTAILFRSFDRSKNASNVRVNQAVLNAAAPALDRARAKLDALLTDPTLPRATPSDDALYKALTTDIDKYTLGDEKPLKLVSDFGDGKDGSQDGKIESQANNSASVLENDETLTTAWRFPVDTDNNGKFDSYTLYGIYFRSPTRDTTTGQFKRPRNPLETRTGPMDASGSSGQCAAALGTSASLVGNSSWYKAGGQLKKSFYVYTATVPITTNNPPTAHETYKGNKGFSALEFQQDRARIPLSNNAVVYEDDVEITPGPTFRLNGRLVTNSNLLVGNNGYGVYLFQLTSPYSCYYEEENSKIVVGGNVAAGGIIDGAGDLSAVDVDLFQGAGKSPDQNQAISSDNKSTNNKPFEVSYNTQAYAQRIARLVDAQYGNASSSDPSDVTNKVNLVPASQQAEERRKQLEIYFRNRTRRVPSSEVPYDTNVSNALGSYATSSPLQGSGDTLRPPDAWMYPTSPSDGKTGTGYTGLSLKTDQLQATELQKQKQNGEENYLGDRIQAGNNLPALWYNNGVFVGANTQQNISGATWKDGTGTRYRQTRVQALAEVGITDRDGDWEQAAAAKPKTPLDNYGGLRVITGAGVYERKNSFLPPPTYDNPSTAAIENSSTYDAYPMVWPDTMPMSPVVGSQVFDNVTGQWTALPATLPTAAISPIDPNTLKYAKGDLRMRATAVYHYAQDAYDPNPPTNDYYQTPIACVSSYYDPTNSLTARNPVGLPDVSGIVSGSQPAVGVGRSNNGVAYPPPKNFNASNLSDISGANTTTGLFNGYENSTNLQGKLSYQANLKFPNGRFVNEPLRNALNKKANNQNLTLSEQSAIDSTICALQILDNTITPGNTFVPNGAIKEVAFLDARQIKAIEQDDPNTNAVETFTTDGGANLTGSYNLSIEERQPLEIRATVLDMNALRKKTIAGSNVLASSEYLLPNSGVIYASRDDALPDLSDKSSSSKLLSPTDFELDPTRRPNSILLTNGSDLSRSQSFSEPEKGLILATNLPVYVQGDKYDGFNLHSGEEFTNKLEDNWSDFYTRTADQINYNFACRKDDPRLPKCTTGDTWRPATILADAITLLSNDFNFGVRNDGDFDLNNNEGDWDSINKRLKNGFWNNNFVTNGLSSGLTLKDADYSANSSANAIDSSYFNNFVTPIQRRVNFPEYVMGICRKLPVSECQSKDWVVTIAGLDQKASSIPSGTLATQLQTGTTAKPATLADQRYARRVAFVRNTYNTLQFAPIGTNATAIPIGIDNTGKVAQFPYSSTTVPTPQNNTLWFRTINNTNKTGDPGTPANITYASDKPLSYLAPNQGGNKLILPDTSCFTGAGIVDCKKTGDPAASGTFNLNLPDNNAYKPASNYTICLFSNSKSNTGSIDAYESKGSAITSSKQCPGAPKSNSSTAQAIDNAYNTLINMTGTVLTDQTPGNDLTLTAAANVNIYDLDDFATGAKITLNTGTQTDPIFILRRTDAMKFGSGVTMFLPDGVNPNNVFWVIKAALTFDDATTVPTRLMGNFIGNADVKIGKNVTIDGGRLLGFSNASQVGDTAVIRAVTSNGQPSLVPVLQLQNTNSVPSANPNSGNVGSTRWMMKATTPTTFNLVAAAGDTPPRVKSSTSLYESNGGLYNFVRFLENWTTQTTAKISGSFIQLKRSAYATAPWSSVLSSNAGGIFNYPQGYRDFYGLLGNGWGYLPYYIPPNRQWGFDVALLSQSPDLFAQRLTLPPTSSPKEFFREVGRDDSWIQTLLCAAVGQKSSPVSNYTYTNNPAVDDRQNLGCPQQLSAY